MRYLKLSTLFWKRYEHLQQLSEKLKTNIKCQEILELFIKTYFLKSLPAKFYQINLGECLLIIQKSTPK